MLSSRNPLALKWYMLIAQGLAFFAIYYAVFRAVIRALNLRTPGREDDEDPVVSAGAPSSPASGSVADLARAYLGAIGGASNIANIDACITRLRLSLKDAGQVNESVARQLGASGVIRLDSQNVQIIVGPLAELVAQAMREQLSNPQAAAATPPSPGAPADPLAEKAARYIALLGGAANLTSIDACITRLRLVVVDSARVDQGEARRLGASGVITIGAQNVHVIVGGEAELLAAAMRRQLPGQG